MRGHGTYFNDAVREVEAGTRPQAIPSTNTAPTQADASAIVARVAHVLLRSELDWSESDLFEKNPSLQGLTPAQIQNAITEALA